MKTSVLDIDKAILVLHGSKIKPKSRGVLQLVCMSRSYFCYVQEHLAKIVMLDEPLPWQIIKSMFCGFSDSYGWKKVLLGLLLYHGFIIYKVLSSSNLSWMFLDENIIYEDLHWKICISELPFAEFIVVVCVCFNGLLYLAIKLVLILRFFLFQFNSHLQCFLPQLI